MAQTLTRPRPATIDRSPEAVERRRRAFEEARHDLRLEGLTTTAEGDAIMERVVAGEIDNDEAERLLIELHRSN